MVVEEALGDGDNSLICLSPAKMEELDLFRGDEVLIKGHEGQDTVCIALADDRLGDVKIRLNEVVRRNLKVGLGDIVSVCANGCSPYATHVRVRPVHDTLEGPTGNLFDTHLRPYYLETFRPTRQGDLFLVRASSQTVEFVVVDVEPAECCIVAPGAIIHCEGEPAKRLSRA